MKQTWLKYIRVVVSLTFISLITLLFIDFTRLNHTPLATLVIYPQFIPSLQHFITAIAWLATGFIAVLLLTLLFGRVYCSMLCPLGILQDVIIRITHTFRKQRRVKFRYQKPLYKLRYTLLLLTVILSVGGSSLALILLDPFSNFGRIAGDLFRPIYVFIHNGSGELLNYFGIHAPFPLHWKNPDLTTLIVPALFLFGLIWLSVKKGRLFCNTLCPVGTLLGLVARFALFKIAIPKDFCILCANCAVGCKAGCINLKTKEIDFSRCVACFNCITVCGAHGIGYKWSGLPQLPCPKPTTSTTLDAHSSARRTLLRGVVLGAVSLMSLPHISKAAKPKNRLPTKVANRSLVPVAPPGALNLAHFNAQCTACHLCVSACPYLVLQPSLFGYGLPGILQPHLDFSSGYCSYDCQLCSEVCPTGALFPLDLALKRTTQLGIAQFVPNNCIVLTDNITCGVCVDYCPTHALRLITLDNGLGIPKVDTALCIGCGTCENTCPARPFRAIYVEAHTQQQRIQPPALKSPKADAINYN